MGPCLFLDRHMVDTYCYRINFGCTLLLLRCSFLSPYRPPAIGNGHEATLRLAVSLQHEAVARPVVASHGHGLFATEGSEIMQPVLRGCWSQRRRPVGQQQQQVQQSVGHGRQPIFGRRWRQQHQQFPDVKIRP